MPDYWDSQNNEWVSGDRPQPFGSGLTKTYNEKIPYIDGSFPAQAETQPAHLGSQSNTDVGSETTPTPRADPRPGRYLERGRNLGKGPQYTRSQADANLKAFDSGTDSFWKGIDYIKKGGPDT